MPRRSSGVKRSMSDMYESSLRGGSIVQGTYWRPGGRVVVPGCTGGCGDTITPGVAAPAGIVGMFCGVGGGAIVMLCGAPVCGFTVIVYGCPVGWMLVKVPGCATPF